jgi:adenylosuccinate lyase
MPHKRNPVLSEKVCGLARVVRSLVLPVTEGIALWHERDISHSSVERVCLPDAAVLTEHALATTADVIDGLDVNEQRMLANLRAAGALAFTDGLLTMLIEGGLSRDAAYAVLQQCAETQDAGDQFEAAIRAEAAESGVPLPQGDFARLAVSRLLGSGGLADMFDRLRALR